MEHLTIGPIPQGGTFQWSGKLVQADGSTPIPAGSLQTLTLTIIDVTTGMIINGRNGTDVLNANGVTVDVTGTTGNISWVPLPADNPVVSKFPANPGDGETELHEATFTWAWTDTLGRPLQSKHKVFISVERYSATQTPIIPGAGSDRVTISLGVSAVVVWITSDAAGQTRVAGPVTTDANGNAVFLLTNGTGYYLWTESPDYLPILGTYFVAAVDT